MKRDFDPGSLYPEAAEFKCPQSMFYVALGFFHTVSDPGQYASSKTALVTRIVFGS